MICLKEYVNLYCKIKSIYFLKAADFQVRWFIKRTTCISLPAKAKVKQDKNEESSKIDWNIMKDHSLRTSLKTIFISNRHKVKTSNSKGLNVVGKRLKVQIQHSEQNPHPSVIVTDGQTSYFINPFPGFLRLMISNNMGVPLLDNVLLTRLNWKSTFSFLPQLISEHHNGYSETLNFFGPPGITDNFSCALPILFSVKGREKLKNTLIYQEFYNNEINVVDSGSFKISMFNIYEKSKNVAKLEGSVKDPSKDVVTNYIFERKNKHKSSPDDEPYVTWSNFETVEEYMDFIKNYKLNSTKCNMTENNITFAFVDIPNSTYFSEMLKDNHLLHHHESKSKVSHVFHTSHPDLYNSEKYQMWTKRFGPSCEHVLISGEISYPAWNYKLEVYRGIFHSVFPEFFPLHGNKHCLTLLQNVMSCSTPQIVNPPIQVYDYWNEKLCLNTRTVHNIAQNIPFVVSKDAEKLAYTNHVPNLLSKELSQISYPRLVVLGSGCPAASLFRASPSFLLFLSKNESVLLDCGGETLGQLCRHFGENMLSQVLATVKIIIISHKHPDHWAGILDLLQEMHLKVNNIDKTLIFLPSSLQGFFERHGKKYEKQIFSKVHLFSNEESHDNFSFLNDIAKKVGLKHLSLVPVDHGPPTFGVVLDCYGAKRIVYSSDTLPLCQNLIMQGKNADLLIHDSLYIEDTSKVLASFKMHSTMSGAIATAHQMKAKNLMLTHFTGNCNIIPVSSLHADMPFNGNIMYALDHLEISLDHLKYFHHFHNAVLNALGDKVVKVRCEKRSKINHDLVELYDKVHATTESN